MALTAGIVGLPNVGKSTLFNAITKARAEMANYPFATIDPNVGMVEVPDERLARIDELIPAKKIVPTTFEFTDIAGIVKGASKGEGLGNKFLENIRQTDAIIHVVRAFDDDDITHVTGQVDPIADIDTINLELIMADLDSVNNRLSKVQRAAKGRDKDALAELAVLEKLKPVLEAGQSARTIDFTDEELPVVKGLFLLTTKPILYVANVAEDEMADPESNQYIAKIREHVQAEGDVIGIAAAAEEEIAEIKTERKQREEKFNAGKERVKQLKDAEKEADQAQRDEKRAIREQKSALEKAEKALREAEKAQRELDKQIAEQRERAEKLRAEAERAQEEAKAAAAKAHQASVKAKEAKDNAELMKKEHEEAKKAEKSEKD